MRFKNNIPGKRKRFRLSGRVLPLVWFARLQWDEERNKEKDKKV